MFIGTDPDTGRRVDRTVTIRASRADAERELAEMVASARAVRAVGVRSSDVVVRSAFAQAMRWGWVWDNPAERAHRIVTTSAELRPPTPAELRTLFDHVATRDPQLHLLLVLAAFTGARRAQLLGLRWHNVHFETGRVSFCAGWVEGPDGPVLAATKTKRGHVVDLDADTLAATWR